MFGPNTYFDFRSWVQMGMSQIYSVFSVVQKLTISVKFNSLKIKSEGNVTSNCTLPKRWEEINGFTLSL